MSKDQQEIGFGNNDERFPPKKSLYDKILENQEKKDNTDISPPAPPVDEITEAPAPPPPVPIDEIVDAPAPPPPPPVLEENPPPPAAPSPPADPPPPIVAEEPKSGKPKRSKRNKRLTILFSILIVLMLGVIGYLIYVLTIEREEAEEMRFTLELQKDNLTTELNELYAEYDSLQTNNDSMNTLIEERQKEIRNLLAIRASNSKKIQIYEEQVSSLRKVLRDFVFQVDSLNTANLRLQAENRAVQDRINKATNTNRQLEEVNKNLEDKVEKASAIKAINVQAEPIENNGNVARKIKRTDKIRVNFALADNAIAKAGLKRIYVTISNPNQRIMIKNASNMFEIDGKQVPYSEYREIEYEGIQLPVSIYYDADEGEIISGTYYVDLYMDGERIGTTTFSLK